MVRNEVGLDEFADEVATALLEHVLWYRESQVKDDDE